MANETQSEQKKVNTELWGKIKQNKKYGFLKKINKIDKL